MPRWTIYLFDTFVSTLSLLISIFWQYKFKLFYYKSLIFPALPFIAIITVLLFISFRISSASIKFTNYWDASKIISINFGIACLSLIIQFYYKSKNSIFISNECILINFYTATFLQVGYRMLVRHHYKIAVNDLKSKRRIKAVLLYNDEMSLLIKKMISDNNQSDLKIVAFLDLKSHFLNNHKKIEGIPVYSELEESLKKFKDLNVKVLIVPEKSISVSELSNLFEKCTKFNIEVQILPDFQKWINQELQTSFLKNINIEDLLNRETIKIDNEKIFFSLKNKKVLVTGAAGSIGSELVRQLTAFKPSLIILCDMAESPLHEICLEIQERFPQTTIKPYIGDICDRVRMEHLFEIYAPEIIFHAAAYKHVPLMEDNPSVAVSNNVLGTKIIAELAVAHDVEKFVMVSTDKAVNPTNVMGASKRIAEIFTQSYFKHISEGKDGHEKGNHTKFITTRFGNVLGSNGSVIPRFKHQIEKGGPITVTHPDITRYFMTIPEACQLVIEAGVMGNGGEIFVFDMGEPVKIVDLAHKMIKLSGKEPSIDIDIVFTGLRPGEKLYEELLSTAENCMPTYHDKIMIAKVREYNFRQVEKKIETLIKCAQGHYTYETVSLMKDLVPEFISNNSSFESLDIPVKK